ncbi:DNA-binding transcriptional regulator Fis [Aliidiomarina minuta]|uniref:Putative Fis-like DNA-binding protein n=1 Tax=Aliidiomarina minuta TaxID=880057 RepID=A0A432W401_9GAMM|nr:DNA-binding transcriptional regulator Fis [Aliidiomarina minuta]
MFDQNVNRDAVNTPLMTPGPNANPKPLRNSVKQALNNFLTQLEGEDPQELYELVLSEVEAPLLEEVMTFTRGNQTRAATMLGINRGTLRKKLKKYGMN